MSPIIHAVDVVLLTIEDLDVKVALFKRENPKEPFHGTWSLPGAFVNTDIDQNCEDTASRVLMDKAGLTGIYLEQLKTFSGPSRDPRGWSCSTAFFALVPYHQLIKSTNPDMRLLPVNGTRTLPFDHDLILDTAVERLRSKASYSSLPLHLLPSKFSIFTLHKVYESILGTSIDRANFRRKILDLDILEPTGEFDPTSSNKKAGLYRLKKRSKTLTFRDRGLV